MKRAALLLALCASVGFAQQQGPPAPARTATTNVTQRVQAPTYSDLYCAGFITKQAITRSNYIVAAAESPHQSQFNQGSIVYLDGTAYSEGARYSVLRALHDPNRSQAFAGQSAAVSEAGQPYAELGRVRVTAMRGKTAVAVVEFSCTTMAVGDTVVPFQEKPPVTYRGDVPFDMFPAAAGRVSARIVLAKDFDWVVGTGEKVYINAGADKGVKVGDYFRAFRTYDPAKMDSSAALSFKAPQTEDTQQYGVSVPNSRYADLPKRAVAQMIVLNVTPTSSTAMVTYAQDTVDVGDMVELEGGAQQ
jgi:hypothetical protein